MNTFHSRMSIIFIIVIIFLFLYPQGSLVAHIHTTEHTLHADDKGQASTLANNPDDMLTLYMPTTDVIIDVGHGGIDGGASFGKITEKAINLHIAKLLYEELRKRGINVALNRDTDYALSDDNKWSKAGRHKRDLAQRSELPSILQSKALVSLHVNSSRNTRGSGPLVLHQANSSSELLANLIQQELNRYYKTRYLVRHVKHLFVLNRVQSPAILVEMGFISNAADRAKLTTPKSQQMIAQSIAKAIEQYLNVLPHLKIAEAEMP